MNRSTWSSTPSRTALAALLAGAALTLAACGEKASEPAAAPPPPAMAPAPAPEPAPVPPAASAPSDQPATTAGAKMDAAGDAIKQQASEAKDAVKDAGNAMGAKMDDAGITAKVHTGLAKDPDLSTLKIDVDTKDGVVTLKGPAPNAAAKERAETIAKGVEGVKSVNNDLEVKM